MPRLNHANLAVTDVPALRDFFAQHFGFRALPAPGASARGADAFAVLDDGAGFVLTLMRRRADDPPAYPGSFHVGFYLDTPEAVHAKRDELAAAGCEVGEAEAVRRGGFASVTCYCRAPGGVLVEVTSPHPTA